MGTSGMRYSLQSRDLIADSIETVTQGQWYDANISLVTIPPQNESHLTLSSLGAIKICLAVLLLWAGLIVPPLWFTEGLSEQAVPR